MITAPKQVHYGARKGMKRVDRNAYAHIDRHPIVVVSWAVDRNNLGGMVRACEAHLVERFHSLLEPSRASAVGTEKWLPIRTRESLYPVVEQYKALGYTAVGLEITDQSTELPITHLPERMCLMVGDEGHGLSKQALELADMCVEIPQFGFSGSLNVTVATGIALYEWACQHASRSAWRSNAT